MKNLNFKIADAIRKLDYINAFILLGFCFFSFAYADILLSGFYSLSYLKGHILDWYDFNHNELNNYLPSTYIFMALWQYIPFKFFGYNPVSPIVHPMVLWLKAETLIFAVLTALVIKKIVKELGCSDSISRFAALFWFATPFTIFSLLIFSQMDIFTSFFMMLGIYYLIKRDLFRFSLYFGVSITFKYFPALIFVPLLLFCEKKLWKAAGYGLLFILPAALEVLVYKDSHMFRQVFLWGTNAGGKLFSPQIYGSQVHIYPLIWSTVTAIAYWSEIKKGDEFNYWVLYIPMLILVPMFMLIGWYPQWLMVMTPFWALTTLYQKKIDFFTFVEIIGYYFYLAYIVSTFATEVDAFMFMRGGMGAFGLSELKWHMFRYFIFRHKQITWSFTAVSACLFVHLLLKFPFSGFDFKIKPHALDMNYLRLRLFCGTMFFAIPAILCLKRPEPILILIGLLLFPTIQFFLIQRQQRLT